jgi:hypothetical protein
MPKQVLKNELESEPKGKLTGQLRAAIHGAVVIRHEDSATAGIPDLSCTYRRRTTWWEIKLAKPEFPSNGIQELTMLRLDSAGYARYIIFEDNDGEKRSYIVRPKNIKNWKTDVEESWSGWDFESLVEFIRKAHFNDYIV